MDKGIRLTGVLMERAALTVPARAATIAILVNMIKGM